MPRDRRSLLIAFAGGVFLAIVSIWLSAAARGQTPLAEITPGTAGETVSIAITVFGVILLGAVPVLLALDVDIYSPLITIVVLFAWAYYTSWHALEEVREEGAATISIYPDAIFGVFWLLTLGIVLVVGGLEYVILHRLLDRK